MGRSVKLTLLFGFTYHQGFLSTPYCWKTLSNHFRKNNDYLVTLIKVIRCASFKKMDYLMHNY